MATDDELFEGVGVDNCPGGLCGGIFPVSLASFDWGCAEIVAEYTCEVNSMVYKQLLKANLQPVGGNMHYLTFTAIDNEDNLEKVFRAKVWEKPIKGLEVEFCKGFIGDEQRAIAMRREITTLLKQLPPMRKAPSRSSLRLLEKRREEEDIVEIEASTQELNAIAFWCLVEELRSLNPTRKIRKAKRVASKKWKSFSRTERMPYIAKAQMKFSDNYLHKHMKEFS